MNDMVWFKNGDKAVTNKILVLVYTNSSNYKKKQFNYWYNVKLPDSIQKKGKKLVTYDLQHVKLDTFFASKDNSLLCQKSGNYVYCKLYEIT